MNLREKALRQYRHNTDTKGKSDGPFVCAYDIEVVDREVARLLDLLERCQPFIEYHAAAPEGGKKARALLAEIREITGGES